MSNDGIGHYLDTSRGLRVSSYAAFHLVGFDEQSHAHGFDLPVWKRTTTSAAVIHFVWVQVLQQATYEQLQPRKRNPATQDQPDKRRAKKTPIRATWSHSVPPLVFPNDETVGALLTVSVAWGSLSQCQNIIGCLLVIRHS